MQDTDIRKLKVAIVHYWLVSMRGGEKVIESMCRVFPQADIYTLVYRPEAISDTIKAHKITTSFLQRLPGGVKAYQNLLPLMPFAVEAFDLSGYDLVISSDTNVTKGVVTPMEVLHVNYCHTPMRYAWDMYHDYMQGSGLGRMKKLAMGLVMNWLRIWDVAASNRIDHFLANSKYVKKRIAKHYRRDATVVYPPADLAAFSPRPDEVKDFYLVLGQIIPYKRIDIAVEAFNRLGKPLVIIGEGSEVERLRARAKPNVRFLGRQPFPVIREHFATCRAFVFPGVEDFGITPVEAQASGRPVLAFGRGGALETVIDGETGLFFREQTPEALMDAVERLEAGRHSITVEKCVENADRFSEERFRADLEASVRQALAKHRAEMEA
jgi:glycosyltransferase involved in cell wall biosynthesis